MTSNLLNSLTCYYSPIDFWSFIIGIMSSSWYAALVKYLVSYSRPTGLNGGSISIIRFQSISAKNGWFLISWIPFEPSLFLGSRFSSYSIKSWASGLIMPSSLPTGGYLIYLLTIFLKIFSGSSSLKGKTPVRNSYTITPKDQKSRA